jgi:hypothetical protein
MFFRYDQVCQQQTHTLPKPKRGTVRRSVDHTLQSFRAYLAKCLNKSTVQDYPPPHVPIPQYILLFAVAQFIEALRHKTEGRGFDSRWGSMTFGRTVTQGMTQPLTEMSTSVISCGVKAAGALGLTLPPPRVECLKNSGSLNLLQSVQAYNGRASHIHTSETSLLTLIHCFPSCSYSYSPLQSLN